MKEELPFGGPAPEVSELLRRDFEGPDGPSFIDRLAVVLRALPARDTEWDVLAGWARPGVLVAAVAAGLLLGVTLWQNWYVRSGAVAPAVSVAMLEEPRPIAQSIVFSVMGER
jgi:hypothetical protein